MFPKSELIAEQAGLSNSKAWFALMVKSHSEDRVQMLLHEREFKCFLPKGDVTRRWSDRNKTLSLPLFEGYVFCHMDLARKQQVLSTPGVITIAGYGKRPVPVATEEIASLQRIVESGIHPKRAVLVAGQRVRVVSGPLWGLEGTYIASKNDSLLTISLTLLQRAVSISMPQSFVEVIH